MLKYPPHRLRYRFFAVLLAVILGAGALGRVVPAEAADASIVLAAWQALIENHVDNPNQVGLLSAALGGVRQVLSRAGINDPLADLSATDGKGVWEEFQARFDQAMALAQGRIDGSELQYAAASAMADSVGDSHTRFFTPDAFRVFLAGLEGQPSYVGIGVSLLVKDDRNYLTEVFTGGPAARAGLRRFDRLLTVDSEDVQGLPLADIARRVRGQQGTMITITVQRRGEAGPLSFSIVREAVAIPPVEHMLLERGVGYVRFHDFTSGSAGQIRQALEELQKQGARAVVLDLRNNVGGWQAELIQIINMLLPAGLKVFTQKTRQGWIAQVATGEPILPRSTPLVALVNASSMSSSEVLVAALQDHRRALVVGEQTAGRVQNTRYMALPGGARIGVPIARMFRPKGLDLEGTGVTPDHSLEMITDDLDRGIDSQLQRAIELVLQRLGVRPTRLVADRAAA